MNLFLPSRYPVGGHWAAQSVKGDPPLVINDDDVLTVAELKELTHVTESDALMKRAISAARAQFERDTGFALPTQRIAVGYDEVNTSGIYLIPRPPLQEITQLYYSDINGGTTSIDLATGVLLQLDLVSMPARLIFAPTAFANLPPPGPVQALGLVVTAGYTADTLPPDMKWAVGLLASHYLTFGRDLATLDSVRTMPMGYQEVVDRYRLEVVV